MGRGGSGNWRDQRMCQKAFWAKVCIKILIILHAGSCKRWINGGELVFQSKKSGDYHGEMTSEHFEVLFVTVHAKTYRKSAKNIFEIRADFTSPIYILDFLQNSCG